MRKRHFKKFAYVRGNRRLRKTLKLLRMGIGNAHKSPWIYYSTKKYPIYVYSEKGRAVCEKINLDDMPF